MFVAMARTYFTRCTQRYVRLVYFLQLLVVVAHTTVTSQKVATFNEEVQRKLSITINRTVKVLKNVTALPRAEFKSSYSSPKYSHCNPNDEVEYANISSRIGCCQPDAIRVLHNVKVDGNNLISFGNSAASDAKSFLLPPIHSVVHQYRSIVQMTLEERNSKSEYSKR